MKKSSKSILYLTMIVLIIAIAMIVGIIVEKSYNKIKITEKGKTEQLTQISENNSYIDTTTHFEEVENAYNNGYTEGYAAGQNNTGEIEYKYHTHGDGYCNSIPVYHSHTTQTGACYTPQKCGGSYTEPNEDNSCRCKKCSDWVSAKGAANNGTCPNIVGYTLTCGKTTSTVERYKCTVTEDTIVSATIKYK